MQLVYGISAETRRHVLEALPTAVAPPRRPAGAAAAKFAGKGDVLSGNEPVRTSDSGDVEMKPAQRSSPTASKGDASAVVGAVSAGAGAASGSGDGSISTSARQDFIEQALLPALNRAAGNAAASSSSSSGSGSGSGSPSIAAVTEELLLDAEIRDDAVSAALCRSLLSAVRARPALFPVERKGRGVICCAEEGFAEHELVTQFLGDVYPAWRWCERQDAIRIHQPSPPGQPCAADFYNIVLERHRNDARGYDVLWVDGMHRGNYASLLSHSCDPNCSTAVVASGGRFTIALYTLRRVRAGEELTIDYCSLTDSPAEHRAAVCLCGSRVCRRRYIEYAGERSFRHVVNEQHSLLERTALVLRACMPPPTPPAKQAKKSKGGSKADAAVAGLSRQELAVLDRHGFRASLLSGLPVWAVRYAAGVLHYAEREKTLLPERLRMVIAQQQLQQQLQQPHRAAAAEGKTAVADSVLPAAESSADPSSATASLPLLPAALASQEKAELKAAEVLSRREHALAVTLDKLRHVIAGQQLSALPMPSAAKDALWLDLGSGSPTSLLSASQLPIGAGAVGQASAVSVSSPPAASASSTEVGEQNGSRAKRASKPSARLLEHFGHDAAIAQQIVSETKAAGAGASAPAASLGSGSLDWAQQLGLDTWCPPPLFALSLEQVVAALWNEPNSIARTMLKHLQVQCFLHCR